MTKLERLKWLKEIEKDIYVCSLESTFADDSKSCAIHSAIEELEKDTSGVIEELEKIKQEMLLKRDSVDLFQSAFDWNIELIENHISKLKGEQNG